jgi:hypothetical protein
MSVCRVQLRHLVPMASAKRTHISDVWFAGGAPGGGTV